MEAVGVHVFAGGFTMGIKQQRGVTVTRQLETHGLGRETVEQVIGVPFEQTESWSDWPRCKPCLVFGNPRCTGFSCITSGYDGDTHGPLAKQNRDIWDLCQYGAKVKADFIVWESVQQAFNKGALLREMLMKDVFKKRYKIAHVLATAASFGCSQDRRRYFFVARRRGLKLAWRQPPWLERPTIMDVLRDVKHADAPHAVSKMHAHGNYSGSSYSDLSREEWLIVPHIPQGWDLNRVASARPAVLKAVSRPMYMAWLGGSDMAFSMHCVMRPVADRGSPTLFSSRCRMIHPELDRPVTVAEFAALMCWPNRVIPRGPDPFAQMAKGVCPPLGKWVAQSLTDSLRGEGEDLEDGTVLNYTKGKLR